MLDEIRQLREILDQTLQTGFTQTDELSRRIARLQELVQLMPDDTLREAAKSLDQAIADVLAAKAVTESELEHLTQRKKAARGYGGLRAHTQAQRARKVA